MRRVVIVGAGFAGLRATRTLAGKGLEVVVIDRQNYHLFQPLLYQVASAGLEPENIAYPIRSIIRDLPDTRFMLAEVRDVYFDGRQVHTDLGAVAYHYLVLAVGSVPAFFGLGSVEEQAHALKELGDAVALRNHILYAFERAAMEPDPASREALMTIVIVGAGPTGVEFAGALAEVVYGALTKDYPDLPVADSQLLLLEAQSEVLTSFPPRLQQYAHRRLERLGVEVRLNTRVVGAEPTRVLLGDGTAIPSCTLFWAAGVQGAPLAESLAVPKTRGHRIAVAPDLSLEGRPEVFVVGDLARVEQDGQPLLMVAPVAIQEGEHAARNILRREKGQATSPFRYRSRGNMAIIGRYAAVADAYKLHIRGVFAWVIWLALHLYYLIGFRNRLVALLNWAYAYFLVDPKLRLITGDREHLRRAFSAGKVGHEAGNSLLPPESER